MEVPEAKNHKATTQDELPLDETRELEPPTEPSLSTSDMLQAILTAGRCVHGYRIYCSSHLDRCFLCTSKAMFGGITPDDLPPPRGYGLLSRADWEYLRDLTPLERTSEPEEISEEPAPPITMAWIDPFPPREDDGDSSDDSGSDSDCGGLPSDDDSHARCSFLSPLPPLSPLLFPAEDPPVFPPPG